MTYNVVIIGAGISGLSAALELSKKGIDHVLILEYQNTSGGFTRNYHDHQSFEEERKLVEMSKQLNYPIWTNSTVVGLFPSGLDNGNHHIYVQGANGKVVIEAKKVIIATGALEKSREPHMISGTRPAGILTPYLAVSLLQRKFIIGQNVVIFENGRITTSLVDRLKELGVNCIVLTKDYVLEEIQGVSKVENVRVRNVITNEKSEFKCDALVYKKGRIAGTFFLKGTPIHTNQSYEIEVTHEGLTNIPNIYAVGSCTVLGNDDHTNSIDLARNLSEKVYEKLN
ncbi:NAD(P)/FAD-dependent oxidoreductase [Sporosarcina sp. CAU 1771]